MRIAINHNVVLIFCFVLRKHSTITTRRAMVNDIFQNIKILLWNEILELDSYVFAQCTVHIEHVHMIYCEKFIWFNPIYVDTEMFSYFRIGIVVPLDLLMFQIQLKNTQLNVKVCFSMSIFFRIIMPEFVWITSKQFPALLESLLLFLRFISLKQLVICHRHNVIWCLMNGTS